MLDSITRWTRRDLLKRSGFLALPSLFRGGAARAAAEAAADGLRVGEDIYRSIGVRPLINARGTFTIISGSQSLPEVKRATEAASHYYVHIDELMEAVSKRLAEITQAEWGIVTAGCAAANSFA